MLLLTPHSRLQLLLRLALHVLLVLLFGDDAALQEVLPMIGDVSLHASILQLAPLLPNVLTGWRAHTHTPQPIENDKLHARIVHP